MRRVASQAGVKFFNLPIGSPITQAALDAARLRNGGKSAPKGASKTTSIVSRIRRPTPAAPLTHTPAAASFHPTFHDPAPSGPQKFTVDGKEFSVPAGTKLMHRKGGAGEVSYGIDPAGEVHVYTSFGEADLTPEVQAKVKALMMKDSDDLAPGAPDAPSLPEGRRQIAHNAVPDVKAQENKYKVVDTSPEALDAASKKKPKSTKSSFTKKDGSKFTVEARTTGKDENGDHTALQATDEKGNRIGEMNVSPKPDGSGHEVKWANVPQKDRRQGIASAMHETAEKHTGSKVDHAPTTEDGQKFADGLEAKKAAAPKPDATDKPDTPDDLSPEQKAFMEKATALGKEFDDAIASDNAEKQKAWMDKALALGKEFDATAGDRDTRTWQEKADDLAKEFRDALDTPEDTRSWLEKAADLGAEADRINGRPKSALEQARDLGRQMDDITKNDRPKRGNPLNLDTPDAPTPDAPEAPADIFDRRKAGQKTRKPAPGFVRKPDSLGESAATLAPKDIHELSGSPYTSPHIDPETGEWTPERAALHDQIINDFLDGVEPADEPVQYMNGGGPASGKGTLTRGPNKDLTEYPAFRSADDLTGELGDFSDDNPRRAVLIDPDALKLQLPETKLALERLRAGDDVGDLEVQWAGNSHEESSYLAKRLHAAALERGVHVIFDGTGNSSAEKLTDKVNVAKDAGYRVEANYIYLDPEEGVARAASRAARSHRTVPAFIITDTYAKLPSIFDQVKTGVFDKVRLFDNNEDGAGGKVIAEGDGDTFSPIDAPAFQRYLASGEKAKALAKKADEAQLAKVTEQSRKNDPKVNE